MGRRKKQPAVSASALSRMGVCEQLVVFEHCTGRRLTSAQKVALQRGLSAHQLFASEGQSEGLSDEPRLDRCSIAPHVLGEGSESGAPPRFRDRILRDSRLGRSLILSCYRVAARVYRKMERWPLLCVVVRTMLRPTAWRSTGTTGEPESRHVK